MSESRPQGIGVTIKYGKEYDKTWVTFQGAPEQIASDIKTYFDLDVEGLTLHEIVTNATQLAHGTATAVSKLKGKVVPQDTAPKGDEAQTGNAWEEDSSTETAAPASPYTSLLEQVEDATSVAELKTLYAKNKELFTAKDDEGKAAKKAWSAKGKALQASA